MRSTHKSPHILALLSLLLAAAMLLTNCGIGTEVGNGVKGDKEDDKAKSAGGPPTEQSDSSPDSDVDPNVSPLVEVDLHLLTAACGSPFGDDFEAAISMASDAAGTSNRIAADYDGDASTWTFSNPAGSTVLTVTKNPSAGPYAVTAYDADGVSIDDGYTCSAVDEAEDVTIEGLEGTYLRKTLILTKDDRDAEVTWYLGNTTAPYLLKRITVGSVDGETGDVDGDSLIILDAAP